MKTYICTTCQTEFQGLSAAARHTQTTGAFRSHPTKEKIMQITGFTFISTKRDGRTKLTEFGDQETFPTLLAEITKETTPAEVANMVGLAFSSSMSFDDQINLV